MAGLFLLAEVPEFFSSMGSLLQKGFAFRSMRFPVRSGDHLSRSPHPSAGLGSGERGCSCARGRSALSAAHNRLAAVQKRSLISPPLSPFFSSLRRPRDGAFDTGSRCGVATAKKKNKYKNLSRLSAKKIIKKALSEIFFPAQLYHFIRGFGITGFKDLYL